MLGISAASDGSNSSSNATTTDITNSSVSAGPVADTPPFSATSDALNQSSFTDASTMASVPNSTAIEPDSNATVSVSNPQNHDNATTFGTDGYNWSSATTQGRGGGGGDGGKWLFGFDDLALPPHQE